ncbi:sensor histidine kinase [Emticicia sp. C21]|uniref:sensor histidine kinase n=1 Tax=Emticicia sp. C21 TaxID=2302915 RepID=UPI000E34EAB1|nr:sensor histidine kinase [Emticicia sp. C21]RFS16022.1 sensor histidine kinase [Emticicia sp. C21]
MIDKKTFIRFNLIFWILYFLYEWLGGGAMTENYHASLIKACVYMPAAFMVSYLSIHILFEKYFLTDRKTIFWVGLIFVVIVSVFLKRAINYYYVYPYIEPHPYPSPYLYFPKLLYEFVNLYFLVFLYSMFYFMRGWYKQQEAIQDLKQEKTAAELELLKSQVQPHFIFNTLNSIYAEAFKKSPETAQQIIKLSNLIEYTLYDSKKEKVALEDELKYIRNYVDLQKIRIGDKVDISFNIYNNINHILIPPLLLLPIIENCFKHGVNNSIKPSWLRIDISVKKNELVVKVENSVEPDAQSPKLHNGGLGLSNVERRLALLYPGKHDFKIYSEANSFLVVLKLVFE